MIAWLPSPAKRGWPPRFVAQSAYLLLFGAALSVQPQRAFAKDGALGTFPEPGSLHRLLHAFRPRSL